MGASEDQFIGVQGADVLLLEKGAVALLFSRARTAAVGTIVASVISGP